MIPAFVNGELRRATPGARGNCPVCAGGVYARIPEHAIRHWAHLPLPDGTERICAFDRGEMTEWHLSWQHRRTDLSCIEVAGPDRHHFADVVNAAGQVIEFQHSGIKPEQITDREQYWRRGAWVIDGTDVDDQPRVELRRKPDQPDTDVFTQFTWPRAHKLLYRARWPCWVDLGDRGLIQVRKMYPDRSPAGGDGWQVSTEWFTDEVVNGRRVVLRWHRDPAVTPANKPRQSGHARQEKIIDFSDVFCSRDPEPPSSNPWEPREVTTSAIEVSAPSTRTWSQCQQCGNDLYLQLPGRTICARCLPQTAEQWTAAGIRRGR